MVSADVLLATIDQLMFFLLLLLVVVAVVVLEVEVVVVVVFFVVVVVNCRKGPEYDHRIAQKTGWTMLRYCKNVEQRSKCVLKYK